MPLGIGLDDLNLGSTPNNSTIKVRSCVKCPQPGTLSSLDSRRAVYCKPCFMEMIRHKFRATLGKQKVFKGLHNEALVAFDGSQSGLALLSLIHGGLSAIAFKKLEMYSTVVTVISTSDVYDVNYLLANGNPINEAIENFGFRPIMVHIGAIFEDQPLISLKNGPPPTQPSDLAGWNHAEAIEKLLNCIKTETAKRELKAGLKTALLYRLAEVFGIDKIVISDSLNELSKRTLNHIAFGRGAQISDDSAVVDKRHPSISVVRPFREISDKEIAIFNRFEDLDKFLTILPSELSTVDSSSIQKVTDKFVDDLQSGFSATVTTILSSASKVRGPLQLKKGSDDSKCLLCFSTVYDSPRNLCYGCDGILSEISDKNLLPDWLKNCCE